MLGKLLRCIRHFEYQRNPASKVVVVRKGTQVYETDPATRGEYRQFWAEKENHDNE